MGSWLDPFSPLSIVHTKTLMDQPCTIKRCAVVRVSTFETVLEKAPFSSAFPIILVWKIGENAQNNVFSNEKVELLRNLSGTGVFFLLRY